MFEELQVGQSSIQEHLKIMQYSETMPETAQHFHNKIHIYYANTKRTQKLNANPGF